MRYTELHKVVGCGNLVATPAESELHGRRSGRDRLYTGSKTTLIVEHWDVIEEIGPEDTWVNSGKF